MISMHKPQDGVALSAPGLDRHGWRIAAFLPLAVLFTLASAHPLQAQTGGAGWNAWLGCWEPTGIEAQVGNDRAEGSALCVVPTAAANAVEFVTLEDGQITDRQRLVADGAQRRVDREGCEGWESLEWSADGQRLFQRSEFDCPGELRRASSGLFSISADGEWFTVQTVSIRDYTDVRGVRYRPAPSLAANNPEVQDALSGRRMAMDAARAAAATPIEFADVLEATEHVELAAVEGWLIERGDGFDLDADRLREIADAGVSERLIDLMVALSYPDKFAIDRSAREGELRPGDRRQPARGPGTVVVMDPWYPGYYGGYHGRYGRYGRWYGPPVVVVRAPERDSEDQGGRLVKGRGYTRGGSDDRARSGTSTRTPSSPRPSTGSRGSSGSGGSDDPPARTAKPRSN